MYIYGEDKEYTQGWDDCEEQIATPLELDVDKLNIEIISLEMKNKRLEDLILSVKEKEDKEPIRTEAGKTAL